MRFRQLAEESPAHAHEQIHIMMDDAEWAAKQAKPNCTECQGCKTQVEPIKRVVVEVFGQQMKTDTGASPEWLFFAGTFQPCSVHGSCQLPMHAAKRGMPAEAHHLT